MKNKIIERIAKTGAKLEIFIESEEYRSPSAVGYVDGKHEGSVCSFGEWRNPKLPAGYVNSIGRIGITAEEKTKIEAELKAANEWYRNNTFSGLREQRENLVSRWQGSMEEADRIRTRNFHKYDTGHGMGKNDWDVRADEARGALRAFDAAHPEVKARIEQEKSEAAQRFAETN